MPCYKPLMAWVSDEPNVSGKCSLTWDYRKASPSHGIVSVPCGKCVGCRAARAKEWAIRCVHEASLYEQNCFVTLTYNDFHLPKNRSLEHSDFQKFMKRFRKLLTSRSRLFDYISDYVVHHVDYFKTFEARADYIADMVASYYKRDVRYFMCGEYGDQNGRPHYHVCFFNFDFPDRLDVTADDGSIQVSSKMLQDLWSDVNGKPLGFVQVGDVNFKSAAYVARYVDKKIYGDKAEVHYVGRCKEYVCMSRRPGIGSRWFDLYSKDVYPDGYVIHDGFKVKAPKYYDSKYSLVDSDRYKELKLSRKEVAEADPNNDW